MPHEDLKPVMNRAKELARISGLGHVGLAHLALALFEQVDGELRRVLVEDCRLDLDTLVARLRAAMPRTEGAEDRAGLAFSPELQVLLEDLIALRARTGSDHFGMELLAAALFRGHEGAWRVFLETSGIDAAAVAELVLERGSELLQLPLHQVDVFCERVFGGNPAAVVRLESWLTKDLMQAIAAENNLSETVFCVREGHDFRLRWFTPLAEVDFCGHATLGCARILFDEGEGEGDQIRFHSAAGPLTVTREGDRLVLDGPCFPVRPEEPTADLAELVGLPVVAAFVGGGDLILEVEDEAAVRRARPRLDRIAALEHRAVAVTARGLEADFVSRFFAPRVGVPEDPATGSLHCVLAPFWGERLGRRELRALQLSARGGEMICRLRDDRVELVAGTRRYLSGRIRVPRRL
ncbi:MAG: PhzF family phenazine biosynthesis isomerase [Planctomycetes bacterium]|nr:PhzF family phenazine biosynthesis isomerase [Planctomycetota bacterium]